ncbi:ABC transporter permease [Plastorhodobacter daqingensis]|uniref:ABC transporter permease n=1 Tax=Plastorhodobacter daqingensis TaxID=1387281 RepID=A0ABW2UPH4_9RHOB
MSRASALYLGLPIAVIALAALSLFVGVANLRPGALWSDPEALRLLAISRIPRTFAALLTGGAMAVAGVIMQMLVRNRFVEPGTAGTAQGAALGILGVTLLAPALPLFFKMIVASVSALLSMLLFLALIRKIPPRAPLLVPLVGLVYSGVIGAAVTFIGYQTDLLQYVEIWMNGEFSGVISGRYELLWLAGGMAIAAYVTADQFTIAGLGRDASVNLGLNYRQVVALGLAVVSMTTALVVVTVGMIPFVGLVVPNIVARLMGDNLRASLPMVACLGGAMVLGCDILGRVLRFPYEVPVGTVFGVLGAAVFLWLLFMRPAHAR